MNISFSDLIYVYNKSEFLPNSNKASYYIDSDEDVRILKHLASDDNYETTAINLEMDLLKIGETISIEIGQPKISFGRLYDSIETFILGDMAQIHNATINQSPYYIKNEKISSIDENKSNMLLNYQVIKNFLYQLISMDSYTDNVNNKLIFFSKKTFELSIDINQHLIEFHQLLISLSETQRQVIANFELWLNNEETSSHIDEKKSILALVLSEALPKNATLMDLINQIQDINESVQAQYALYLENFSYEKFVKKLEENSEKFVSKINDTVSKVLPQFLALPFLTAIPTALKSSDNWLVYLAICIFCIMCIYGLTNQKLILDHIEQDVNNYESKGKIPEKLKSQWKDDKSRIEKLVSKQKNLYVFLLGAVLLSFIYAYIKLLLQLKDTVVLIFWSTFN